MKKKISKRLLKKIDKEEMEDILHNEEVEARWKDIANSGVSRKAEETENYWKKHLDPFYAEIMPQNPNISISEAVKKEIEEYEKNDPIFYEFDAMEQHFIFLLSLGGLFYCMIGVIMLIWIVMVATEDVCTVSNVSGLAC